MEIKIYTGMVGAQNRIHIQWADHNGNLCGNVLDINVKNDDKPRTLEILLDNIKLTEVRSNVE